MPNVSLIAPSGAGGTIQGGGATTYAIGADGIASVDSSLVPALLGAGWRYARTEQRTSFFQSPIAAELVSIVAAAAPTSGTPMTVAAQPDVPRKLQVRGVYSGAVASLVVNLVGVDGRGNAVTETVNVAGASSTTFNTVNAYATVTSVTPVGTVTNVTTIGVGVGAALALPLAQTFVDLTVYKAQVAATGTAVMANEAVGTVDTVAGTISPTSAPTGAKNFQFWYTAALAD